MKKITVNFIIIMISLLSYHLLTFAQTTTNPSTQPSTNNSKVCSSNKDCSSTQVCDFFKKESNTSTIFDPNGICVSKCPETPCPEEKPICDLSLGGVCKENCASGAYKCPSNMICEETTGMCMSNIQSCSENADCENNSVCDTIIPNDNHIYENKSFGYCSPKCSDNNSCKMGVTTPFRTIDKNVCNDNDTMGGLCVPNCNSLNYSCPTESYCDTKSGACMPSTVCEKNSDCEPTMVCNSLNKNTDNQGIVTRGGVCEPKCPEKECPTGRPICDLRLGGLCVEDCTKNGYKCPLYNEGKSSLKCMTEDGENKGLCIPESKTCKLDTDCDVTNEVCDYLSITKEHKFKANPTGTCVPKCNENAICDYTNNTPFRSPEKPKCNTDVGGLCQPDCALKIYTCPNCTKCNQETGLCYNFTEDAIIIMLIRGNNVSVADLNTNEAKMRALIANSPKLTKAIKDKIIITSSSVSKYLPAPEDDNINQDDITMFIIQQKEAKNEDTALVEDVVKRREAVILSNHGRLVLKEDIIKL